MKSKFLTALFYSSLGLASALALFLLLYWSLLTNSSITSLVNNTKSEPIYLFSYALLTLAAIVLFGLNVPLLIYRWRKHGPPNLKRQAGSGLGSVVGVAASACPVCGSTLLTAVGIAGGLAAFPLQGLELKALSMGLMALPVWLTARDLKHPPCDKNGVCPTPRETAFRRSDRLWLVGFLGLVLLLSAFNFRWLRADPLIGRVLGATGNPLYDEVAAKVLPRRGFQSKIALQESVVQLVQAGVIDREKFLAIYQDRGGLPTQLANVLDQPSNRPILLTRDNATIYVNLLWPLGLANYMESNQESPIKGDSLFNFASTGGWNLGHEENGGAYFNKLRIVTLSAAQEALVTQIAKTTFRPCCDNSTFFQDCNHGSALLGLLQLGASQGLTEDELYREALAFNSHWFPHNYIQTGLYFKVVKNTDWEDVSPKEVMGYNYSAIGPWIQNVQQEIAKMPNLLPQSTGGAGCST